MRAQGYVMHYLQQNREHTHTQTHTHIKTLAHIDRDGKQRGQRRKKGGRKRGQEHCSTREPEDKTYYKIQNTDRIKSPFVLSVHSSIHQSICLSIFLSLPLYFLLREGMEAFSETSSEISFGVTLGGKWMNVFTKTDIFFEVNHIHEQKGLHRHTDLYAHTHAHTHKTNIHSVHILKPYCKTHAGTCKDAYGISQRAVILLK